MYEYMLILQNLSLNLEVQSVFQFYIRYLLFIWSELCRAR